jgi:hypothetical protein
MSKTLKFGQHPDRVPVKITVMVSPDLKWALGDYAAAYASTYGQNEAVTELIPYMLVAILAGALGFQKPGSRSVARPNRKDTKAKDARGGLLPVAWTGT